MLRQVIQGAGRLHYQVGSCKYSIARKSALRSFSATASQAVKYGGPNDKIRIFEQPSLSSKKRVEIDLEAEDAAERKDIENELAKLDDELEVLSKGPLHADSPFVKSLPERERIAVLEALEKYEAEHGHEDNKMGLGQIFDKELDDLIKEEFEGMAEEEEEIYDMKPLPKDAISGQDDELSLMHPYISRFEKHLLKVAEDHNETNAQELWRWYQRCKDAIPSFLSSLESETFQLLWQSQIQGQMPAVTRKTHVQALVEDFNSVGRALLPHEVLQVIDILHEGGDTEEALQLWEESQTIINEGEGDLNAYWSTGVRLFAANGDPQRAQDIAFAFLTRDGSQYARVLIPIALAWSKHTDENAAAKAWAIYLQLKTLLGSDMQMKDYDIVSTSFLNDGNVDLAVAVFKDMMITGKDPTNDSTAVYKRAIGLAGHLQASSINEEDVNKISLSALTILPRRFQNRFFYASWMKKLIGMGEVDSAAAVVELMFERGVKPDAIHLNGVIGGWLRNGSASSRDKAEKLGWSMIQHRIDTVWSRIQHPEESTKPAVPELPVDSRIPAFLKRTLPPANIETFSILLLHYTRRGDDDMVKYLNKCLSDAQIRPNSYYMNHLLYAELRKHQIHGLWEKFKLLSRQVAPDLETFACLWDCGKIQYDRSRTAYDANFPAVRQLFSIMINWYSSLGPREQKTAQEEFSRELYDQITRCFCLSRDLSGTLVALYVMKDLFNFHPDDSTARMLVLQIARIASNLDNSNETNATTPETLSKRSRARARRRLSSTPQSKENIQQVQTILNMLQDQKAKTLQAQGISIDQLEECERSEYQLEILGDLLLSVIERVVAADDSPDTAVKTQVSAAMQEMAVDGLGIRFHSESLQ